MVPGTVAAALGPDVDVDGQDWWFRTEFDNFGDGEGGPVVDGAATLVCDGLATVCDVYLNGDLVAHSESMFLPVRVALEGRLRERNELAICCRALAPLLSERRRPRARWRTALVSEGNLRFFRTMLLGRAPGFAPGPPVVGPWRPVRIERGPAPVEQLIVRPRVEGADGVLSVRMTVRGERGAPQVELRRGGERYGVRPSLAGPRAGEKQLGFDLRVRDADLWWPHTHGEPALYELTVIQDEHVVHRSKIGFRTLDWPVDWAERGFALAVNGTEVFCRGAVWTPPSLTAPHVEEAQLRATLTLVRDAGMNMLRIPGIACYESDAFHDLCDELGILVWQDFMFANLDYPDADEAFMAAAELEARHQLGRLAGRPSLAVLCGGSECAQQVTMLGLDPELARGPLYTQLLPRVVEDSGVEVPYIPNAPWGGPLPFRPRPGVANYYGVGAYRRPLSDARLAAVGFAAECLAFSNIPDEAAIEQIAPGALTPVPHLPAWKAGIPRDAGAGWDFEDVRDHYLKLVYDLDPVEVRWTDPERYLELGRAVTGEVMAETVGEWRRAASPCAGALILWLRDLRPGAGWGVIDSDGRPKVALAHLRRAFAPVSLWIVDEGLSGMTAHLANDTSEAVEGLLRVALYRDGEVLVEQASVEVALGAHASVTHDLEAVIGRFLDIGWTYRFGPPGHDTVVASFERGPVPGDGLIGQAFRFPVGRPLRRQTAPALGLEAIVTTAPDDGAQLRLRSRRVVHGLRIHAPGWMPADDALTLEPGVAREVALTPRDAEAGEGPPRITVTALNLTDRLRAGVDG